MRIAPCRDLSDGRAKSLDSRAFLSLGGRGSLLKIGARLETLRLPSHSTYRAHRKNGYSGLGLAPLCSSPVYPLLQEFGWSNERRNR
jgi:hypothetical protein